MLRRCSPFLLNILFFASIIVAGVLDLPQIARAQGVASEVATPTKAAISTTAGTARQQAWLSASIDERIRLAEGLGEDGGRAFAQAKGYAPILDGSMKNLAQGPDWVGRASDGTVHVLEFKGGSGQLGHAYGFPQGSSEWAVESAKRMLSRPTASAAEKAAGKSILRAAAEGKLQVDVVRTTHVLGEPMVARLEQSIGCTEQATRLATTQFDDLANATAQVVEDTARATEGAACSTAASGSSALRSVAKVAVPVAVALDTGVRVNDGIKTERQFAAGEITVQQREIAHARNAAGMAGGWGGAWAGAEIGSVGGGAAGTAVAPGPGTAVGAVAGGIAGGIAGYVGGEAAAEAAAEWTVTQVHAAGTTVTDAVSSAWNWTSQTGSNAWTYVVGK